MQFDQDQRGFSFSKEGPLDMRMDPTSGTTAKEIVNTASEKDLGEMFKELGEEKLWRKAAKAIVEARKKKPIVTTTQLAKIIEDVIPRGGKIHPATKIFRQSASASIANSRRCKKRSRRRRCICDQGEESLF